MRMGMQADFNRSADFAGDIALAMVLARRIDGVERLDEHFMVKAPKPGVEGWAQAKTSDPIPANGASVCLEIRGQFRGSVQIRDIVLEKRSDPK
jgi:hypothetical protein